MAIPIFSVGETKSRIVVIFEKRTGDGTVDGIYKADIDKEFALVEPEQYTFTDNASRIIPIEYYAGANPANPDTIMHLELVTEKEREVVGILFVATDESAATRDDTLYAGQIIGDLFVTFVFVPLVNLGTIHKVYGKFRADGKMYLFVHRTNQDGEIVLDSPLPHPKD